MQLPRCRFTVSPRHRCNSSGAPTAPIPPHSFDDCDGDNADDEPGLGTGYGGNGNNSGGAGSCYRTLVIGPWTWTHTTATRTHWGVKLTRMQLPLIHAWAITVHKSQVMMRATKEGWRMPGRGGCRGRRYVWVGPTAAGVGPSYEPVLLGVGRSIVLPDVASAYMYAHLALPCADTHFELLLLLILSFAFACTCAICCVARRVCPSAS